MPATSKAMVYALSRMLKGLLRTAPNVRLAYLKTQELWRPCVLRVSVRLEAFNRWTEEVNRDPAH
jgi:hypothetical protein